jgi:hypothetical protein
MVLTSSLERVMNGTVEKKEGEQMAGESNYEAVLLHSDNEDEEKQGCPNCHNLNMDTLEIDDGDCVTCLECGHKYEL